MIGFAKINDDIDLITKEANKLRQNIINDTFLKNILSVKKYTTQYFHAKNDHLAVKREFFNFIKNVDFSAQIIIRRKNSFLDIIKETYKETNKKNIIEERFIYNDCISRIFRNNLHKEDSEIVFANTGNTFNNRTIKEALNKAIFNFTKNYSVKNKKDIMIKIGFPKDFIGLQIIDYVLWSIKQLYFDKKEYYLKIIENKIKLIIDLDDKREKGYGVYYTKHNKINLDKIKIEK